MRDSKQTVMPRNDFVGLERIIHLAAGGEAPMLRAGVEALHRFTSDKGMGYVGGYSGRNHLYEVYATAKRHTANLLGCSPAEIAFLGSASDGVNAAAASLKWRPGDNVVVPAHEFPSVLLPWVKAGVEVHEVAAEPGGSLLTAIADACDASTRMIAVSHVSYLTGERLNLDAVAQIARRQGALLLVDASHSLGVLPVQASVADFLVSCCYKFLLATHGVGIFYCNQQRVPDFEPSAAGWHSVTSFPPTEAGIEWKPGAARFEHGNPGFPGVYVLETAAAYLGRTGPDRIAEHVLHLGGVLHEALSALGLPVTTPRDAERRGPNICFAHGEADELTAALRLEGIYVWGGAGRVRMSLHGYNDEADVQAAVGAIKRLLNR